MLLPASYNITTEHISEVGAALGEPHRTEGDQALDTPESYRTIVGTGIQKSKVWNCHPPNRYIYLYIDLSIYLYRYIYIFFKQAAASFIFFSR